MTQTINAGRRFPWFPVTIATVLGLVVFYLGSMPLVWKLADGNKSRMIQRLYEPVIVLMEETPAREPLLGWCEFWGSREQVKRYLSKRKLDSLIDSPIF
ncbi:MAG: hypothetical protein EXS05_16345 [Planctomycetaceae bacterium]|nr:hypothetical protein [Planctomycetaceae bacterium]